MATWCHRPTQSLAGPLTWGETSFSWHGSIAFITCPTCCRCRTIVLGQEQPDSTLVQTADWSDAVAPFWDAVIASLGQWQAIAGVLTAGWPTLQGVPALFLMQHGFASGLIRYGVLSARKPPSP
jgi:tocopherol O-methyltransferase